jgi:hypothetical protein
VPSPAALRDLPATIDDAHLLNFGLWATPDRNLSFDLRDFDETHPGPFEWDVKRLGASVRGGSAGKPRNHRLVCRGSGGTDPDLCGDARPVAPLLTQPDDMAPIHGMHDGM